MRAVTPRLALELAPVSAEPRLTRLRVSPPPFAEGLRADLVAAKRQVSLAEAEAEAATRQLQQREAEIAATHRSLQKLDDLKASAQAQDVAAESLRSQLRAAMESNETLRADTARLKKALAAREAAARSAQAPPATHAHAADPDAITLAQAREMTAQMGELTCVLALLLASFMRVCLAVS